MSIPLGLFNGPTDVSLAGFLFLGILAVWSLVWKGFALWISAREQKKWWFIALLIFNTVGILEIVYIFVFSKTGKRFLQKMKSDKKVTLENKE